MIWLTVQNVTLWGCGRGGVGISSENSNNVAQISIDRALRPWYVSRVDRAMVPGHKIGVGEMKVNIGKGIELDVNTSALPENVMDHVVYMGLRNILMDSHASHTKESSDDYVEKSRETAEKKLAALLNGEVRAAGTREGDPVRAEAIRLATLAIRAAIRKAGKKLADVDAKAIREKAVGLIEKYREQAEKNVAEAKAASVDLDGLI